MCSKDSGNVHFKMGSSKSLNIGNIIIEHSKDGDWDKNLQEKFIDFCTGVYY
jgi:hypothetical protein